MHVICALDAATDARDLMETLSEHQTGIELGAILAPSTAVPEELDRVVAALERSSLVRRATWAVSVVTP